MFRSLLAFTCMSLALGAAAPLSAQAQERHRVRTPVITAPPLTVKQRSWLDVGNVVAVGTQNTYVSANETLHEPVYTSFAQDRFGRSTLPGRFDLAFSNENPRGPNSGGIFFDDLP